MTSTGADGPDARVTGADGEEATDVPAVFDAETVKVYVLPTVNPVTVTDVEVADALTCAPPGDATTV